MRAMDRPLTRGLWLIGVAVVVLNGYFLVTLYGPGARIFVTPPGPFPMLTGPDSRLRRVAVRPVAHVAGVARAALSADLRGR